MKPNPIFSRKETTIINDGWQFSFDNKSWQPINVPYSPQSKLSGIGYTDFIPVCYYKKTFLIETIGERLTLHFGAVDYRASVYVNDIYVGSHVGGYTPFSFDITNVAKVGKNVIYMVVNDDEYGKMLSGKQSPRKDSYGCFYTRTTGIWQSVWLEKTPKKYINNVYFYPNIENCSVDVDLCVSSKGTYSIEIYFNDHAVGSSTGEIAYSKKITISLTEKHLWELGKGNLYDVKISFEGDEVCSYFGLREVRYQGYDFLLNGKKTYQVLVLDQGYNPEGLYTPSSVEAMQKDIAMVKELGFNGVRLHQKLFEPQFLYLCDKAGYMVWGEYPSWGIDYSNLAHLGQFITEWEEALRRDFNHPSIVIWSPLNEAWGDLADWQKTRNVTFIDCVYEFTKKFDKTRPCVDVSGGHHGHATDLYDFHCYEDIANIQKYLDQYERAGELDIPLLYCQDDELRYQKGLPVHFSECGGISFGFDSADKETETVNECAVQFETPWGYGKGETDGDAFLERYSQLVGLIVKYKMVSGFCYTQLYDIEQEQNGFYYYNRSDKLTKEQKEKIKNINESLWWVKE